MEFQPTIEIKRKHLYMFVAIAVFLFGGFFLASAQADKGIPEAVREKLGNENPGAWTNSGDSGESSGSSSAPERTHDSIEVKTVLGDEVVTVQEALSSLDQDLNSLHKDIEDVRSSGSIGSCTVEIRQCVTLYEEIVTRFGDFVDSKEQTNCGPTETISGSSGEVQLSSPSAPSSDLDVYDYGSSRARVQYHHNTDIQRRTKVSLNC